MSVLRARLCAALALIAICWTLPTAIAEFDQAAAGRVLGPQWEHMSRRAGMVFAGTVLSFSTQAPRTDRPVPSFTLRFRVDRAIAGVEPGQILTIHVWTSAWSLQQPMQLGKRILLFLYPQSRLGLTSPVGGLRGQIRLDATGSFVPQKRPIAPIRASRKIPSNSPPPAGSSRTRAATPGASPFVTLDQLERAIRAARNATRTAPRSEP
jgi:hypothetical protein